MKLNTELTNEDYEALRVVLSYYIAIPSVTPKPDRSIQVAFRLLSEVNQKRLDPDFAMKTDPAASPPGNQHDLF